MNNTRDRILEVSSELFRRQGLSGTGIKQILGAAKVPFGSLYHHFPGGKDQLAAEAITRAGAFYAELVLSHLLSEPDPVASIRATFRAAGDTLRDTDYADACPIETIALEVASTNEPLRIATAEVFDSWTVGLSAWLTSHGVADAGARPLALTILSSMEGAFVLCRATRSTAALDATADAMASLVAAALASP